MRHKNFEEEELREHLLKTKRAQSPKPGELELEAVTYFEGFIFLSDRSTGLLTVNTDDAAIDAAIACTHSAASEHAE